MTAISPYVGAQVAPRSPLVLPLSVFFPPPSCDVRWGLPCCDEAALITGSWTVCGSRSVIILQPGGHAEIKQSTSATWCSSQIYSHAPHITAVQVFKRCHIGLNTGIMLGWRKRRNRSVTDSRRETRQEEGENDIFHTSGGQFKVFYRSRILDPIRKETNSTCINTRLIWQYKCDLPQLRSCENSNFLSACQEKTLSLLLLFFCVYFTPPIIMSGKNKMDHEQNKMSSKINKKREKQNESQEGRSKRWVEEKSFCGSKGTGWEKNGGGEERRGHDQRRTAMTVTGENQSVMLNRWILWPLTPPVWQHLTHHPSLPGHPVLPQRTRWDILTQMNPDYVICVKNVMTIIQIFNKTEAFQGYQYVYIAYKHDYPKLIKKNNNQSDIFLLAFFFFFTFYTTITFCYISIQMSYQHCC